MFPKRLKMLRESNNMSMDRLIELYNKKYSTKMNKSTLSRYENGLQDPIYTQVVNLADFFGVSVDYITCNDEKENKPEKPELAENMIVYHRDGKTSEVKLSPKKMNLLIQMIEEFKENDNPDL